MKEIILCKLGEIVLKGLNRRSFEQKLLSNLRHSLYLAGHYHVRCSQSTVTIEGADENADMDAAFEAAKKVFGIIKLSRAAACAKDPDAIAALAGDYLHDELMRAHSFKVESRRSDKRFPMTSIELSQYVGGILAERFGHLRADMHEPDVTVHLEIRDTEAYVHASPVDGAGGMPVGSNGVAVSLLSGGIDSPVSSYMIAKRGVRLIPVHFFSFPYTSEAAKEKVIELARLLTPYCGKMELLVVPFTRIQEQIREYCPEPYFTLVMRRFMMRIASAIARENGAGAIVTGENLGQVASQTMEAMASTQAVTSLPVLQPLIGMDKEEIIRLARRIGTFETSILPYEDCCTVFTPRHPKTHPTLAEVEAAELVPDIDALVREALAGTERIQVGR